MSDNAKPELPPPSLWRTVLNLLPLIILTWYLCQNRPDKNPDYQLDLCGKNMHEMGVALEKDRLLSGDLLYNADFSKVFPEGKIPACPVGGDDAYKEGYQVSADRTSYLLVCKGDHHKEDRKEDGREQVDGPLHKGDAAQIDGRLERRDGDPLVRPVELFVGGKVEHRR